MSTRISSYACCLGDYPGQQLQFGGFSATKLNSGSWQVVTPSGSFVSIQGDSNDVQNWIDAQSAGVGYQLQPSANATSGITGLINTIKTQFNAGKNAGKTPVITYQPNTVSGQSNILLTIGFAGLALALILKLKK